jgi:hypothetical protein
MASRWYAAASRLLIDSLQTRYSDRHDYFVGGNMLMYFCMDQAQQHEIHRLDFFYTELAHLKARLAELEKSQEG